VILARNHRDDQKTIIPFLVDQSNNMMCFITSKQKQLISRYFSSDHNHDRNDIVEFSSYFQETLKIHDSVHSLLFDSSGEEEKDNFLSSYFLTVRYRQEYFNEIQGNDARNSIDFYSNYLIPSITSYSMEAFNHFFWTSKETEDFFNRMEEPTRSNSLFLEDQERYSNWKHLESYLYDHLNQQMRVNIEGDSKNSQMKDICKINHLRDSVEFDAVSGKLLPFICHFSIYCFCF
jgi:transcriptional regulator of heat shock response